MGEGIMQTEHNSGIGHTRPRRPLAWLWSFIAAIVLVVCNSAPAYADTREILSTRVFQNLAETGDMCIFMHYYLDHTVPPTEPVNTYYQFRLMDVGGTTQIGAATAYPYYNYGYGEGLVAWYFPAATAPVWGSSYILRMEGNPEYFASPVPVVTYTLTSSDYSALGQAGLEDYIIDQCLEIELDWGVALVSASDIGLILTTEGEAYLRGTLPGIQYVAPGILAVQEGVPTVTPRTWGTTQADTYATRWAGTWVGDALDGASNFLGGIAWNTLTGLGILVLAVVVFALSAKWFQSSLPGFVGAVVLMLGGFTMGFVSASIFGVTVLLCAIYLGYMLVFKGSS